MTRSEALITVVNRNFSLEDLPTEVWEHVIDELNQPPLESIEERLQRLIDAERNEQP